MTTVVVSASNVANYPEGGGHFWVFMQYVDGLRRLGCDVYWLERFRCTGDTDRDQRLVTVFLARMERYGLAEKHILYTTAQQLPGDQPGYTYIGRTVAEAEAIFRRTDLLLNFHYAIDPSLLASFPRTALIDIDPGLLQFWMSTGQLHVPAHDFYFTTGETVGTPAARFADCGLSWSYIHPPVSLERWPFVYDPNCDAFTTVSGWWGGGGKGEWITDGKDTCYENNKRVTFLEFVELPHMTDQALELALCLGDGDVEDQEATPNVVQQASTPLANGFTTYAGDAQDRQILEHHGWRIRHAQQVAGTPELYQAYIHQSRGEFSCAKPSCMRFQNAWISDRTLCYLASGKPAVVQHTGQSVYIPNGEGLFRFMTKEDAAEAFASINADYRRHSHAAREIAETYFDAKQVLAGILNSMNVYESVV